LAFVVFDFADLVFDLVIHGVASIFLFLVHAGDELEHVLFASFDVIDFDLLNLLDHFLLFLQAGMIVSSRRIFFGPAAARPKNGPGQRKWDNALMTMRRACAFRERKNMLTPKQLLACIQAAVDYIDANNLDEAKFVSAVDSLDDNTATAVVVEIPSSHSYPNEIAVVDSAKKRLNDIDFEGDYVIFGFNAAKNSVTKAKGKKKEGEDLE
jgi:hypothetical protein